MTNANSHPSADNANAERFTLLHKGKWANTDVYRFREKHIVHLDLRKATNWIK